MGSGSLPMPGHSCKMPPLGRDKLLCAVISQLSLAEQRSLAATWATCSEPRRLYLAPIIGAKCRSEGAMVWPKLQFRIAQPRPTLGLAVLFVSVALGGALHEFVDAIRELDVFWAVINEAPPGSVRK